jgi:Rrf2 family protein
VLSQTAEYALRAVLYLAEHQGENPIPVDAIAEDLSIPRNYLSKILHTLAKRDLLSSSRGRGGGFELTVRASGLPLLAVVEPFDEFEGDQQCLLGRTRCSDTSPCAAHGRWKEMMDRVTAFFRETTVEDLIQDPGSGGLAARRADPATTSS